MKGLGNPIDENGNLIVDPLRELDPTTNKPLVESQGGGAPPGGASTGVVGRLRRDFGTTQALVDRVKRTVPRCLTRAQRKRFYLPPEPPRWCITGPGHEGEPDTTNWRPKWSYHTKAWAAWLAARDRGEKPALPGTEQETATTK